MRYLSLSRPTIAVLLSIAGFGAQSATYQFSSPVPGLLVKPAITAEPAFSLGATSLNFGEVAAPATKELTLVVTNTGNVPLSAPAISSVGAGFGVTHSCAASLAVAETCLVTSTFSPLAEQAYSGTLSIGYAGLSAQSASLSGTGFQNPALSKTNVSLGAFSVGQAAPPVYVTLKNGSTADLRITSRAFSGSAPSLFSSSGCEGVISAGATCSLRIDFTASSAASVTGELTLTHNGSSGVSRINVSGRLLTCGMWMNVNGNLSCASWY